MLSVVPLKVWLILGALVAVAIWYWRATDAAYERGRASAITEIEKGTRDAEKRADDELRRLDRGDRSGVSGFDRD